MSTTSRFKTPDCQPYAGIFLEFEDNYGNMKITCYIRSVLNCFTDQHYS